MERRDSVHGAIPAFCIRKLHLAGSMAPSEVEVIEHRKKEAMSAKLSYAVGHGQQKDYFDELPRLFHSIGVC
jgi:hypothetical protein